MPRHNHTHFHDHLHVSDAETLDHLTNILKGVNMANAVLDTLNAKVDALTSIVTAVPQHLADLLAKAGSSTGISEADVQAVSDKIQTQIDSLNQDFPVTPAPAPE